MKGQGLLFVTALVAGVVSGFDPMDAAPKPNTAAALPLSAGVLSPQAAPAAIQALPTVAGDTLASVLDASRPGAASTQDGEGTVGPVEQRLLAICDALFPQAVGHDQFVIRALRIAGGVVFLLLVLGVSWVVGWEHKKGKL